MSCAPTGNCAAGGFYKDGSGRFQAFVADQWVDQEPGRAAQGRDWSVRSVFRCPLSVDGIEIVASLVLLADRRTGRKSGWLPWAALITGTAASLAANVATAQPDPISRVIAGWPALALLIAVKLLSGMLEHRDPASRPPVPSADDPGPDGAGSSDHPAHLSTAAVPRAPDRPASRRDDHRPPPRHDATRPATSRDASPRHPRRPALPVTPTDAGTTRPGPSPARTGTVPAADLAGLLPAARAARDDLHRDGYPLARDNLAHRLRQAGHPIRNARLTPLLYALRAEAATPSPATT